MAVDNIIVKLGTTNFLENYEEKYNKYCHTTGFFRIKHFKKPKFSKFKERIILLWRNHNPSICVIKMKNFKVNISKND